MNVHLISQTNGQYKFGLHEEEDEERLFAGQWLKF
jgi:hypothetical protein